MGNSNSKGEIIVKCSIEEMIKAFFKGSVIVWHDPKAGNQENQRYIAQLKRFCEVFIFTEWEKASAYIKESKASCHVITSGTNGELFIKEISLSQSVESIYIFCRNKEYHSSWAQNYQKISCIETKVQNLTSRIEQNLLEWYKKASSLKLNLPPFVPLANDSNPNHSLGVILNFKSRKQAKLDFLALSKALYSDEQNMKLITGFEKYYNEYNKSQTLKWYAQESFLYRMTNNCMRIATSDSIQYCRLLLKDLEMAIKEQYQTKSKNFNGLLYRGAYISEEEWSSLKENQDKEIEMRSFLSVSKSRNVALHSMQTDPNKKVLITVIVPKGPIEEEQGFAEVEEYSQYPQEKEVLFNVRSRFTVLETEDDYGYLGASKCRHLVLLYGAQGFRKWMTEKSPVQEISAAKIDNTGEGASGVSEKLMFLSIKTGLYYDKKYLDDDAGPFLCIPMVDIVRKPDSIKVKGYLLKMDPSQQQQTPFYGYKCGNCQAKRQKSYYICTDCGGKTKKWCEPCFDSSKTLDCLKAGHQIVLETTPFSFWCEKTHEPVHADVETSDPVVQPVEKEIIVKCSLEEMMKAFFKDYVIIWHDPKVDSQENQQYIAQLKKFCEVFVFTEWEKVRDCIQSTQAVCHVISSGTNGERLIKEIFESENVCNVYVFCTNKEYHLSWAKNYQKLSCIETNIQNLINQIQQNLLGWHKKASSLNFNLPAFAPIFNDSDKSEMNNLHRYLKIIPNFKNRQQAKSDLLSLSKAIYTDPNNQGLIADFEKNYNQYQKDQTLRWYTLESFLYKVTNNCLRIATSDSIQYCRLALKDIEQAIKDQYQEKSKNFNGLLYRGAYLSQEEWSSLKENQDKEIEMHGFLSVSKDKKVALNFLRDPSQMVLITVIVPKGPNVEEQGFAEIEEYSRYPQEKEILFNVRSRFTVLETEDGYAYSGTSRCRHLVLLYGAQGFRKFIAEESPIQEVSIPSMESISCAHCNAKSERLFFVSTKQQTYCCQKCVGSGVGPFLLIPTTDKMKKPGPTKILGCPLIMDSSQEETPFYGYKCGNCQAKKQKSYFTCTDCSSGKKWCENCFDSKASLDCPKAGHNILLETSPFSFWSEKMSAKELNHLEFQKNLVRKDNDVFQQAQMYFESQEYEKAIEYYSLYIQENEAKGIDTDLALSYHNIGMVYDNWGEHQKALESYLKSLDIIKSHSGEENPPAAATTYNNIGMVYDNQGDYKKALEYFSKALDIRKSIYEGENHSEIATSYNNIANVYKNQGEFKKALEYFLKSLDIQRFVYGDNHPRVAASYNNVGLVFHTVGEYKKALEYYLKSLDIYTSVYGDNHPEVAASYLNIGSLYDNQGEYKKALQHYLKALDIQKLVYGGDNHPMVAMSYNNIGMLFKDQGQYNKALEYFSKSLAIRKSVYGGDGHPDIATSYNNIGNVYDNQGESEKALEYYLKSVDIKKAVFAGENHPSVATTYSNIGGVYHDQGDHKKALEYHLKSLQIQRSVYGGDNHPAVASSYNNIGGVYSAQGEDEKALEYYLKALVIRESLYGEDDHPDIANSYSNIAEIYDNQGEHEKALEYHLKSLDILKAVYGEKHPAVANSYGLLGLVYENQGDLQKAIEYYVKCLEVEKSVYGEKHPYTMRTQKLILEKINAQKQNQSVNFVVLKPS